MDLNRDIAAHLAINGWPDGTRREALVGDVLNLSPALAIGTPTATLTRKPATSTAAIASMTLTPDVPGFYAVALSAAGSTRYLEIVVFPGDVNLTTSAASPVSPITTLTFASTTGVVPGMTISGAGIPPGALVAAVTSTTVTVGLGAAQAVVPMTTPIRFGGVLGRPISPSSLPLGSIHRGTLRAIANDERVTQTTCAASIELANPGGSLGLDDRLVGGAPFSLYRYST